MKNNKVKIFTSYNLQNLEDIINDFMNEECAKIKILDIKFKNFLEPDKNYSEIEYLVHAAMLIYITE